MARLGDDSSANGLRLLSLPAFAVAAMALGLSSAAYGASPPQYALKDLGTLGGKTSGAAAINASGQITGGSTLPGDQVTHVFLYTNGLMKDIGTPSGVNNASGTAINASGQLAVTDETDTYPWIYSNGAWTNLDPNSFYSGGLAAGINDSGHVAGIAEEIPFFWDGTLNLLNNYFHSWVTGINNSDQITGTLLTGAPQGQSFAFVYDADTGAFAYLNSLGGAFYSIGNAINASGHVAGTSDNGFDEITFTDGPPHAILNDDAGMHDLGTLGGPNSYGNALNASSEVVGASDTAGGVSHAFLYSNGTMVDLNTLVAASPLAKYVTLNSANGINDNGWIVANGVDSRTGNSHAYLLEPVSLDGTVTPPASEIVDDSLNIWTVSKGQAIKNGVATASSSVIQLLFSKGVVYQENAHKNWYAWSSNSSWVASAAPVTPSASGTTIPAATNIVDNSLNVWALSGGQVYENGSVTPSGGVILVLFEGGVVYQENLHHNWWLWNTQTQTWIASSDPRVPSPNETSIPPATQIVDGGMNTWTVSKGQVFEDGQPTPSSSVVRLILVNNVIYQENAHNNWYAWQNGKWVASPAPIAASANGTTIPSASQIIDNTLNIWTVMSGVVYENHAPTQSSSVTLLLFYGGSIYQENVHNNWYRWTGSAWVSTPKDPRP